MEKESLGCKPNAPSEGDPEKQIVRWSSKVYKTSKLESARYMTREKINVYGRPIRKTKQKTGTSEKKRGRGDYTEHGVVDLRRGIE